MDENKWNWSTEALKRHMANVAFWLDKLHIIRTYSLNETASNSSDLEANKCWSMAGMAESKITQRAPSHLKPVRRQVDLGLWRIWTKALWLLPLQCGYPNTCDNADHLPVKSGPLSRHLEPCRRETAGNSHRMPCKHPIFCFAKQWWESLRLKFNCTPGKRTLLVHHECDITSKHEKGSDHITGLRQWGKSFR